jgi:hypothetical protein
LVNWGQGRTVSIATGWTEESEFEFLHGREFSFLHVVQTGSEATQPPIQWVYGALLPGINRLGREADHSTPTSAKLKKT